MPSMYLFLLGLMWTSVVAKNITQTTQGDSNSTDYSYNITDAIATSNFSLNISRTLQTNETKNASDNNTSVAPTPDYISKPSRTSVGSITITSTKTSSKLSTMLTPSEAPILTTKRTTKVTTINAKTTEGHSSRSTGDNRTGIIVVVLILLVIFGFAVACLVARRRGRRYSVDIASRPDENVPLSNVEPELHVEPAPQNGLKTFESTEKAATEPKGQEVAPETQAEKKEEAAKTATTPSAEVAAPTEAPAAAQAEAAAAAPPPDDSEEKSKAEDAKQSSSAPVKPLAEEKTDDEGAVSNKTSVESLKETNENNSNNSSFTQRRGPAAADIVSNASCGKGGAGVFDAEETTSAAEA